MTKIQRIKVHDITVSVLINLLKFHVSFNSLKYIHDDAIINWRELEEKLHNNYPIKVVGVKATRVNLKVIEEWLGGFLHSEEDLFPGEVPWELQSFPYEAASAAYVFTLMEGYGDEVVRLINPDYLKNRQAWHHGVYGDAKLTNSTDLMKAKVGFTKPFGRLESAIPKYAVERLVYIKEIRNKFIHESSSNIDFSDFYANVIGTILSIYFMLLPSKHELSIYPYEDYNGKWEQ